MACWRRRGGRWTEAQWKQRWGSCNALFMYLFQLFSNVLWWTDSALRLLVWWRRPRKGLVASYSFAIAFLSLVLRHPAVSAPPNARLQTHVRAQSKTWRLCILHESSTSEGLFALLILLRAQSCDDEVGASRNQKLPRNGTAVTFWTLCAEVNTPICNSVASLCRARKHPRPEEMREIYCLMMPCSVMTPCFLYYLLLILPAPHLLLDSAEDDTPPYCDLNWSCKDFLSKQ